ncbi:hypothetical protein KIL84_001140 [Mauremys mutica]|uniref:Uncharacterized protein n=1 Tax=Mauremys mutica TaxID=74926 RepID=A0A9D3X004_9SAUR|nr:hypothetical protein KIL84_001140 [Mauremys mutica]
MVPLKYKWVVPAPGVCTARAPGGDASLAVDAKKGVGLGSEFQHHVPCGPYEGKREKQVLTERRYKVSQQKHSWLVCDPGKPTAMGTPWCQNPSGKGQAPRSWEKPSFQAWAFWEAWTG